MALNTQLWQDPRTIFDITLIPKYVKCMINLTIFSSHDVLDYFKIYI